MITFEQVFLCLLFAFEFTFRSHYAAWIFNMNFYLRVIEIHDFFNAFRFFLYAPEHIKNSIGKYIVVVSQRFSESGEKENANKSEISDQQSEQRNQRLEMNFSWGKRANDLLIDFFHDSRSFYCSPPLLALTTRETFFSLLSQLIELQTFHCNMKTFTFFSCFKVLPQNFSQAAFYFNYFKAPLIATVTRSDQKHHSRCMKS